MTQSEQLMTGLFQQGWTVHEVTHKYTAFRHPEKGQRTLWLDSKDYLRVGSRSYQSAEPVHRGFYEHTLKMARRR